jgi:hypothetical protein
MTYGGDALIDIRVPIGFAIPNESPIKEGVIGSDLMALSRWDIVLP